MAEFDVNWLRKNVDRIIDHAETRERMHSHLGETVGKGYGEIWDNDNMRYFTRNLAEMYACCGEWCEGEEFCTYDVLERCWALMYTMGGDIPWDDLVTSGLHEEEMLSVPLRCVSPALLDAQSAEGGQETVRDLLMAVFAKYAQQFERLVESRDTLTALKATYACLQHGTEAITLLMAVRIHFLEQHPPPPCAWDDS